MKSSPSKAASLYRKSIVIDALCYIPELKNTGYMERVRKAGVTATNVTVVGVRDNFEEAIKRVAKWHQQIKANSHSMVLVEKAEDILKAKRSGKTGVIMGTQDSRPLKDDISRVEIFKRIGIRIIQLTYQGRNFAGNGCGEARDEGLSRFGVRLVEEMNTLGLLVDLSHCGPQTTLDAIRVSKQPVAISHSNAYSLVPHIRNKKDGTIKAMADKGGVIGTVAFSNFCDIRRKGRPTLEDYLDIMEYLIKIAGMDHVGVGIDLAPQWTAAEMEVERKNHPEIYLTRSFEDVDVKDLHEIEGFQKIALGLAKRGYREKDIRKILGGNFLRLFKQVWSK